MSEPLRVCMVINSLPHGGAEHLLVDLVRSIDRSKATFSVVHFGDDTLAPELEEAGAEVRTVGESFRFDPRTLARLIGYIRSNSFDLIHAHLPYAQTLGRIAGIFGDIPVVSTQHTMSSNHHPITGGTERLTRFLDAATVAVSQGVERSFTGSAHPPNELDHGDEWYTIYNSIDVESYQEKVLSADPEDIRDKYDISNDSTVFLNIGRYAPIKGQSDLIDGFAKSEFRDAHLLIVGYGALEEELQRLSKINNVSDRVHITGHAEAYPYYALADVFVFGSRSEGMPITLLEAMAAKLPVVATDIPGVREVVSDGKTGYLYPEGETDCLGELFSRMTDPELRERLGRSGYERVKSMFNIEQMAETYVNLYENIC